MGFIIFAIILVITAIIARIFFGKTIASSKETLAYRKKEEEAEITSGHTSTFSLDRIRKDISECTQTIKSYKRVSTIVTAICLVIALIFVACSMFAIVPTGHTGIKTTFGKVENDVLSSGINFKLPWQNVINMDNREQRSQFTLQAFSKDIQQVDVQGSINTNINKSTAMNLYKDVGVEYPTILIGPRVYEDVKIVMARYTAENLVENRQAASDAIFELIRNELSEKGINVISFAIENIDFTDAFESAVEAKQVATQEKQKAKTEQERQTMEMQQQAERDRIKAQAEADVKKIEADAKAYAVKVEAEAQAEANKKIAETLSDPLIKYNLIKQWNGKLPVVQSGSNANSIIDIRNLIAEEE